MTPQSKLKKLLESTKTPILRSKLAEYNKELFSYYTEKYKGIWGSDFAVKSSMADLLNECNPYRFSNMKDWTGDQKRKQVINYMAAKLEYINNLPEGELQI